MKTLLSAVAATAFAGMMLPAFADEKKLGEVNFETSCNPEAGEHFNRAMLFQHSFFYRASKEAFEAALKADPECAIAYWGIALSLLYNPHAPPPAANLPLGLAAIENGKAVGAKTQRERDYLDALAVMYADYQTVAHGARLQNYTKAMEALAQRYPEDDEAQIHYALALNTSASPADKTYANQLKGAAILQPILARQPQHPGVTHYIIHLTDYPPLAEKGLDAARSYAKIAPAAPHALHMPSHIFTRVGYWQESIASNADSARAAKREKAPDDELHAMDYLVYAYLQLAQDAKARAIVDEMLSVAGFNPSVRGGPYAIAASPARYMIERGDWKGAAELELRPSRFAYADAMTHFARAIGAARSGDVTAANADLAKLGDLRDKLTAAKDGYWAEQVEIQRQVASAWMLYSEGKQDEALALMRAAADAEDRTEKHPVTPGVPKPARELYGDMLLDHAMPQDALAAFEATLRKEPNRLGALVGAARAAEKADDESKAREYYGKVVAMVGDTDTPRAEVAHARAYLKR